MAMRLSMTIACAIVSVISAVPLRAQPPGGDAAARRSIALRMPIGATVKLRTTDGRRLKAVLFGVDEEGIIVKPATRIPVASLKIAFDRIDAMERDEGRLHMGRFTGIGAGAGGAFLIILLSLGL